LEEGLGGTVGLSRADDDHYFSVAKKLAGGRLIPFLGAGANLCDRGSHGWTPGCAFLPSGTELADHLVTAGRYPNPTEHNLIRVSQYVDLAEGEDELYRYLHDIFDGDFSPTSLHKLLARVARKLADAGQPQLLCITTNYDDLLERALAAENLEYDVIWYEAKENSPAHRKFWHRAPGQEPVPIRRPNKYKGLPDVLERPAVLKLHGATARQSSPNDDSYVITEDSYIDYLTGSDLATLIPISLWKLMTNNSLLFLGYSLADWNLRVILNRIWSTRTLLAKSWAVQLEPDDPAASQIEQKLWEDPGRKVDLVFCDLTRYVQRLGAAVEAASGTP
jgi:hypothetical protein